MSLKLDGDIKVLSKEEILKSMTMIPMSEEVALYTEEVKGIKTYEIHGLHFAVGIEVVEENINGIKLIDEKLASGLEMSLDELKEVALENINQEKFTFDSVESFFLQLTKSDYEPENTFIEDGHLCFLCSKPSIGENHFHLFYLTNDNKYFGARCILQEDLCKRIGDYIGTNFYVIPSSVHELLILPDDGNFTISDIELITEEINEKEVSTAEQLGSKPAYYDYQMNLLYPFNHDEDMKRNVDLEM